MKQVQSTIAEFNQQLENLQDLRRSYALVQERIRTYRLKGSEVPEALIQIERRLLNECLAESQGR
jgi:prefoldin subunit 5